MNDEVLKHLALARVKLLDRRDLEGDSRALRITITHIETAQLWRKEDLSLKEFEAGIEG